MKQNEDILAKIFECGVMPVVTLENIEQAVPLADALLSGGISVIELTFRSKVAPEAISAIKKSHPNMIVGAGTVLTKEQAERAVKSGAQFAVAPGYNPEVASVFAESGVTFIPGVATPTEIERTMSDGYNVLKLFPVEQLGGPAVLDAYAGPYQQIKFVVTGGVSQKNIGEYARRKNLFAVAGSWMVAKDLISAKDWAAVTTRSKEAIAALHR